MIRITAGLHQQIIADLRRPHAFAAERVGFVFAAKGTGQAQRLVLCKRYAPVADEHYVDMRDVGAAINSEGLRVARQESLETQDGIFHAHMHLSLIHISEPTRPY